MTRRPAGTTTSTPPSSNAGGLVLERPRPRHSRGARPRDTFPSRRPRMSDCCSSGMRARGAADFQRGHVARAACGDPSARRTRRRSARRKCQEVQSSPGTCTTLAPFVGTVALGVAPTGRRCALLHARRRSRAWGDSRTGRRRVEARAGRRPRLRPSECAGRRLETRRMGLRVLARAATAATSARRTTTRRASRACRPPRSRRSRPRPSRSLPRPSSPSRAPRTPPRPIWPRPRSPRTARATDAWPSASSTPSSPSPARTRSRWSTASCSPATTPANARRPRARRPPRLHLGFVLVVVRIRPGFRPVVRRRREAKKPTRATRRRSRRRGRARRLAHGKTERRRGRRRRTSRVVDDVLRGVFRSRVDVRPRRPRRRERSVHTRRGRGVGRRVGRRLFDPLLLFSFHRLVRVVSRRISRRTSLGGGDDDASSLRRLRRDFLARPATVGRRGVPRARGARRRLAAAQLAEVTGDSTVPN